MIVLFIIVHAPGKEQSKNERIYMLYHIELRYSLLYGLYTYKLKGVHRTLVAAWLIFWGQCPFKNQLYTIVRKYFMSSKATAQLVYQ